MPLFQVLNCQALSSHMILFFHALYLIPIYSFQRKMLNIGAFYEWVEFLTFTVKTLCV